VFTNVAAEALKIFETEKELRNSFRFRSDDEYFILCALVQNVIAFCSNISRRESNGIRMQKSKREIGDTSCMSLEDIVLEGKRHEDKVKQIKTFMLNRNK
jgi:hypothetical protein